MKFRAVIAAAAAAFAMSPAVASAQDVYAEVGGWSVFKNPENCRAIGSFDGDTHLAVGYYPADDRVMLVVIDSDFTMSNGQELQYKMYFAQGDTLNDDWGTVTAYGLRMDNGNNAFRLSLDGNDFLEDFGDNELIGFFTGDDLVISLRLERSAEIESKLRQCGASI
ncbi:hypothetical protein [Stakelama tenebrarum]|uniref:Uncharacterized protein n=1 Tax=Stakelama tenebrarum TaxID=2711215 RepID=A0A6G6Y894_9SPHN|nr:hypothetical protein [Sphingosinithalassobacter tenebrarum]QIG81140.1 hypothetical protein G5C33_16065 [Sphingosinithalassobacter tenebrarum]